LTHCSPSKAHHHAGRSVFIQSIAREYWFTDKVRKVVASDVDSVRLLFYQLVRCFTEYLPHTSYSVRMVRMYRILNVLSGRNRIVQKLLVVEVVSTCSFKKLSSWPVLLYCFIWLLFLIFTLRNYCIAFCLRSFVFVYFCENSASWPRWISKLSGCTIRRRPIFLPEPDNKKWLDIRPTGTGYPVHP